MSFLRKLLGIGKKTPLALSPDKKHPSEPEEGSAPFASVSFDIYSALATDHTGGVPQKIVKLLWFEDGPYKNYDSSGTMRTLGQVGPVIITIRLPSDIEPSAISTSLPIRPMSRECLVPALPYYPSYRGMIPEQRWVYLRWLCDVNDPIAIGYVFVFYYGLERHLYYGDFDGAFHMVLHLREHHKNKSFEYYSSVALLGSMIYRERYDVYDSIRSLIVSDSVAFSPMELYVRSKLGEFLKPHEIMLNASRVGFTNTRYTRGYPELFEETLADELRSRYGVSGYPLTPDLIKGAPVEDVCIAANISIEIRTIGIPNVLKQPAFSESLLSVLQSTHESVKLKLREQRKGHNARYIEEPSTVNGVRENIE